MDTVTHTRHDNRPLALALAYPRRRPWLALGVAGVIALGLASRKYPALFPAVLGSYTGDGLWAWMVFLGFAFMTPAAHRARLACAALTFCGLIELSQLYQAPWINAIRATTAGHLVLGTGFQWMDLLAYAVGVACGFLADCCVARAQLSTRKLNN